MAASVPLTNPGFESGGLTGWSASGGSVTVVTSYAGFAPKVGQHFAIVEAGCQDTTLSQTFTANAGDTVSGFAFFQANDELPFDDSGRVQIRAQNGPVVAALFSSDVSAVGDYGATPWTYFAYTLPATGTYTLQAVSTNGLDCQYSSVLGLDVMGATPAVDVTPPTSTATLSPPPTGSGWATGPVTMTLGATDNPGGSGVAMTYYALDSATCTPGTLGPCTTYSGPITIASNGAPTLSFFSVDKAGNAESVKTVAVPIDMAAPHTTATLSSAVPATTTGWYRGDVQITLSAADNAGGSGVQTITYSATGAQSITTTTIVGTSTSVTVAMDGQTTLTYHATDAAGNAESAQTVTINRDSVPPSIIAHRFPAANAAGWNKEPVTVTFDCSDVTSGIATCPDPVTRGSEGAGQSVTGTAIDNAGNSASATVDNINIDTTPPTLTATLAGSPNAAGWYNGPVTVHVTCGDNLSGVASCPGDVTLTASAANQSVTDTAADYAGNTSEPATVGGINIDAIYPTVSIGGVQDGAIYTLGAVPTPTCAAGDSLSGLAGPCATSLSGGSANGVGTYTYMATATDMAGNTTTVTATYRVIYRWDGWLQPIDDTAHDEGLATSIFKGGSTIPVKFQLKRADGTVVQANSLPIWLTPVPGSPVTAPVDESAYSTAATSGGTYAQVGAGQRYQYTWDTLQSQAGYFWRVGVTLDDGQTYYVNVGLR